MKSWSIGLATVFFAIAELNSAYAGEAASVRPRFSPPARIAGASAHSRAPERFARTNSDEFRRDRRRAPLGFPFGIGAAPADDSDAEASLPAPELVAPNVAVAITILPPLAAAPAPAAWVGASGPKIITIGSLPRSSHFVKMPIVIYGGGGAGGHFRTL